MNNETNLEHTAYFLGTSLESKNSSLFDVCVLFGLSLVYGNKTNPKINSLPSHLFRSLPTSPTSNAYNFILETLFYALTYRKVDATHAPRITCNRLNALRLIYYLNKY